MSHLCHGLIMCNAYRNYCAILNFKFGECQMLIEKKLKFTNLFNIMRLGVPLWI